MVSNKNLFEVLNECSLEDKDDEILGTDDSETADDSETYDEWEIALFDVTEEFGDWRIFTRRSLRWIGNQIKQAETALQEGRELTLYHRPSAGEPKYGEKFVVAIVNKNKNTSATKDGDEHKQHHGKFKIDVRYLTRLELNRKFQKLAPSSVSVELLRDYNHDYEEGGPSWLPVPFVLDFLYRDQSTHHEDKRQMTEWLNYLEQMKKLWKDSEACAQVKESILRSPSTVRITRIVCFGLGTLMLAEGKGFNRVLEHLMVFQLAEMLDDFYREKGLSLPPVKVFLQDPLYQKKDEILFQQLHEGVNLVQDPYGLLEIDQNTLVIGAYVPTSFPLMQIIADMFDEHQGPAGFLIDHISRRCKDAGAGMYRSNDRLSPRAERMMEDYEKYSGTFEKEALCKELQEEFRKEPGKKPSGYWMRHMELWMQKKDAPDSSDEAEP
jgi:hypothetical protein